MILDPCLGHCCRFIAASHNCGPSDDTNRTTIFTYTGDGLPATITAVNATTGNQTTTYTYGSTLSDSAIASSQLKRYETYPDSVSGSDQIAFTYNRQSQVATTTDQNGTVHSYNFDLLGRQTADRITTLGTGVDNAVLRISTTYEVRGLVQNLTSYDNAAVGSGNVVNDVQKVYNSFGQLTTEYQSQSGAVNVSSTPNVQYAYADGSASTIRPISLTYPNSRVLNYDYGAAQGTNDAASRIASFIDNDGVTHMADYSFLGASTIIQVNEPQPGIQYTLIGIQGGNDPVTGDIYRGLDLFSRVKDLIWVPSGSSSSSSSSGSGPGTNLVRIQHGYDRAGNRLWRKDLVAASYGAGLDELYGYDGLYRLKSVNRGTLNSTQTAIQAGTGTFNQCWTLDSTGNWESFREDDTGSGAWNLVQSRSANTANEITGISNSVGSAWANPTYDHAGNMTTIPKLTAPSSSFAGTYDAWNRLIKLVDDSSSQTVQTNAYDGRNYRVIRNSYTSGTLSETRHYFYTSNWQSIEERIGASTNPNRQLVWGQRFLDDLVLRDRDTTGGGTLNERLYAMQDALESVVLTTDSSGRAEERYAYSPYGVTTYCSPSFMAIPASTVDWTCTFAGYSPDSASQLYMVRHRAFATTLGLWAQRDPVIQSDDHNLYSYVSDRPTAWSDPFGLTQYWCCIGTNGLNGGTKYIKWWSWGLTADYVRSQCAARGNTRPWEFTWSVVPICNANSPCPPAGSDQFYIARAPVDPQAMNPCERCLAPAFDPTHCDIASPGEGYIREGLCRKSAGRDASPAYPGSKAFTPNGASIALPRQRGCGYTLAGTNIPCESATDAQITACLKSFNYQGDYSIINNNCQTDVTDAAKACCLTVPQTLPGVFWRFVDDTLQSMGGRPY